MNKTIALIVLAAWPAAAQLVENGGFDALRPDGKPAGWTTLGANVQHVTADSEGGACRLSGTQGTFAALAQGIRGIKTTGDIKTPLRISVWMRTEGVSSKPDEGEASFSLWFTDNKGRNASALAVAAARGDTPWKQYTRVVTPEELRALSDQTKEEDRPLACALRANLCNQPGSMWVDRVECEEVEPPAMSCRLDRGEYTTGDKYARLLIATAAPWHKATVTISGGSRPFQLDNAGEGSCTLALGGLTPGEHDCEIKVFDTTGKALGASIVKLKISVDPFDQQ